MGQLLGKIVRLHVARARPGPEIVAPGLRNPWRLSFDRGSGDLYIADVGAGLWEEIDYLPRARVRELTNFGWDAWEARAVKEDKAPNPAGRLEFPIHAYDHDDGKCSVTGGYVYRGKAVPAARGRYFFGDYCTGEIWSLRVGGGAATDVRREPFRIRDLTSFRRGRERRAVRGHVHRPRPEARALTRRGSRIAGTRAGMFYRARRRRQRWCSEPCGNRARVARHYDAPRLTG